MLAPTKVVGNTRFFAVAVTNRAQSGCLTITAAPCTRLVQRSALQTGIYRKLCHCEAASAAVAISILRAQKPLFSVTFSFGPGDCHGLRPRNDNVDDSPINTNMKLADDCFVYIIMYIL